MECLDAAPVLVLLFQGRGPGCLGQRADSLRGRGGQFYGGGAEFTVDMPKTTGCANHCGASRGVGGGEIWRNYVFRPRRYRGGLTVRELPQNARHVVSATRGAYSRPWLHGLRNGTDFRQPWCRSEVAHHIRDGCRRKQAQEEVGLMEEFLVSLDPALTKKRAPH